MLRIETAKVCLNGRAAVLASGHSAASRHWNRPRRRRRCSACSVASRQSSLSLRYVLSLEGIAGHGDKLVKFALRDLGARAAALDSGQKVVALAHRVLPCMNSMRSISASTNFCTASTGAPLRMSEAASSLRASIVAA